MEDPLGASLLRMTSRDTLSRRVVPVPVPVPVPEKELPSRFCSESARCPLGRRWTLNRERERERGRTDEECQTSTVSRVTGPGRALVVALLVFLAPGCTTRHIREAQNAFNEAAAAEQRLYSLTVDGVSGLPSASAAASGYRVALNLLEREIADNKAALEKEQLYGTALVLRALCLWRLTDLVADPDDDPLSGALADIRAAKVALGTRDQVLVAALPGLRDHDRGLRAESYDPARRFFVSAIDTTESALTSVAPPANHPVRLYIRLAQLSSCRAWHAAAYRFLGDDTERRRAEAKAAKDRFRAIIEELRPAWKADKGLEDTLRKLARAIGVTFPQD